MYEHLELRLAFAKAVAAKQGIPLSKAIPRFTDLYRIFGLGGDPSSMPPEMLKKRKAFEAVADANAENNDKLLDISYEYAKAQEAIARDEIGVRFPPFDYEFDPDYRSVIYIHFNPMTSISRLTDEGEPSVLSREKRTEMIRQLRNMFASIKREMPDAKNIRGRSWLYNLEAYRSLFPERYIASARVTELELGATPMRGTWGQFFEKTGRLNQERTAQFLKNMETMNPIHPQEAFPLQPLSAEAPIEEFYKFYGLE